MMSTRVNVKGIYRRDKSKNYWLRYSTGGKQIRISLDTECLEVAEIKSLEILGKKSLTFSSSIEKEMEQYIERELARDKLSHQSASIRRKILSKFFKEAEINNPSDITKATVEKWIKSLVCYLSVSTVTSYGFMIRAFCRWLVDAGKIRSNPAKIEMPRQDKKARKNFVDKAQVARLIERAPSDDLKMILHLGFHCGMRKGEIVEARWSWVDFARNCITVQSGDGFRTKDRDTRSIPLTGQFKAFLESRPKGDGAAFLVSPETGRGQWRYRYDFRKPLSDYFKSMGVKMTTHDMRRSFASNLVIAGVSIFKVAVWLGDDVRVVQTHYAHLLADDRDVDRAFA